MLTIFKNPKSGKTPEPQRDPYAPKQNPYSSHRPEPVQTQPTPAPTRQPPQPAPKSMPPMASQTTIIGKGLVFEGEVKGEGSIRVEGLFIGTLNVKDEVIIGQGGKVKGNINSQVVTVLGRLEGNVNASNKITIDVTGSMIGDITAPSVVVAEGAVYKGRIDMEPKEDASAASGAGGKKDNKKAKHDPGKGKNTPPGPPPKA